MVWIRTDKNSNVSRMKFGQIEHSEKNLIPKCCFDHKSNTVIRPRSNVRIRYPNARMYDVIFGHFG